jgi:phosphomannomutase
MVGIALFLSHLAKTGLTMSELRKTYPGFEMTKRKISLDQGVNIKSLFDSLSRKYKDFSQDLSDGLKIDFPDQWIHLRRSNTEPVVRIYTEAKTLKAAESLADLVEREILDFVNNC